MVDLEHIAGPLDRSLGDHDQRAFLGPATQALSPHRGVRPVRHAGIDRLEHQQLGAVQLSDDRHAGSHASGRLVDRRQMMEVQNVGFGGTGRRELARPCRNLPLILLVVERCEHTVDGAGAVLE